MATDIPTWRMMARTTANTLTRRRFLSLAGAAVSFGLLQACSPAPIGRATAAKATSPDSGVAAATQPTPIPTVTHAPAKPVVFLAAEAGTSQASGPDTAAALLDLVERMVAHLRAMGLSAGPPGSSGYGISPASSSAPILSPAVRLYVALNSASFAPASGAETRFGGDGDSPWRLAYEVQRNVVGGMKDVLGYDVFDRGVVQGEAPPLGAGLGQGDPWVLAYPLFSTNPFESGLVGRAGTRDLIASALANAITAFLDPAVVTPQRTAQFDWRMAPTWHPVPPRLVTRCDDPTRLALTYDAGASAKPTPAILKALRDAGIRATIFLTGDYVSRNPDLIVQMVRDGHELGNHTSTHPDLTKVSSQEEIAQLEGVEEKVVALTGRSTRPWFRPPFGAYNDRVLKVAGEQGYDAIYWTTDSADWRNDVDAATVEERILRYATPGTIMIEHLGSPQSAEVLPEVLRVLKGRGISFGTLSEAVKTP